MYHPALLAYLTIAFNRVGTVTGEAIIRLSAPFYKKLSLELGK